MPTTPVGSARHLNVWPGIVPPPASFASARNRTVSPIDVNVHAAGMTCTDATLAGPVESSQPATARMALASRATLLVRWRRHGCGTGLLVATWRVSALVEHLSSPVRGPGQGLRHTYGTRRSIPVKDFRLATIAAVAALTLACDSTSPAPNLDGVWGGLINLPFTTDTLTLAIGEQEGQIRGFGLQRTLDDSRVRYILSVIGSISGRTVELNLFNGVTSTVVRGELNGSTLAMSVGDEPVTLRRYGSRGDGVAGTWALTSTSGPALAIRDTIEILPDGRGRRHREHQFSSYATLAIWSRRGNWLVLEQYAPSGFGSSIPFLDSLQIQSNTFVRSTRLFDGSTILETYTRALQP